MISIDKKQFFWFEIMNILIGLKFWTRSFRWSHHNSKFSFQSKVMIKENCWKWPKLLSCRKTYSFQTIEDIDPTFWKHKLKTWMKVVIKFHVSIFYTFWKNRPWKNVTVGSSGLCRVGFGLFIVLNESTKHKMVVQIYFNLFRFFLKVLVLIECGRDDPYMTVNRNFVRFTHP